MKYFCKSEEKFSVRKVDISKEAATWDSFFTSPNHHLSSAFLFFYGENTDVDSHFFQVLKQNEVVGQIYMQSALIPAADLLQYAANSMSILRFLPSCVQNTSCSLEFLVCGNLFKSNQAGYEFRNTVSPTDVFQALIAYLEKPKNNVRFVGFLVKDSPVEFQPFNHLILYKKDLTMQLQLNPAWKTIGDYVVDLDKKYRNRYKKITKNFENLQFVELSSTEIEQHNDRIYQLYLGVARNQSLKIGEVSKNYFIKKKHLMNERFKLYAVFYEGEIIAFSSHILEVNQQIEIHYIGFDYRYNETFKLYFNILFHGLQCAIETRSQTLELGRTAEVAKASLGAKPHYKLNYLYFRRKFFTLSFKLFNHKTNNNIELQIRNPFSINAMAR